MTLEDRKELANFIRTNMRIVVSNDSSYDYTEPSYSFEVKLLLIDPETGEEETVSSDYCNLG